MNCAKMNTVLLIDRDVAVSGHAEPGAKSTLCSLPEIPASTGRCGDVFLLVLA